MVNFWESSVWGFILLLSSLLVSLLVANIIKRKVSFLKNSLVPTSVIAGGLLLLISIIYTLIVENVGDLQSILPKNIFDLKYFIFQCNNYNVASVIFIRYTNVYNNIL